MVFDGTFYKPYNKNGLLGSVPPNQKVEFNRNSKYLRLVHTLLSNQYKYYLVLLIMD